MGRFPKKHGFIDRKKLKEEAQKVLATLNLDIPVNRLMRDVPFSYRQMIEIAKAASEQTKVLILDESTAALTENEIEQLFAVMRKLAQRGVSIIFISHRIEEVFTISDRITVMRDGEAVSTIDRAHADRKKLLSLMVGRDFSETYPEKENVPGEVVLEARGISGTQFQNISFSVRAGEILGVAGLVGAGRTEIMRAIFGADRMKGGEVLLDGMRLEKMTPARAIRRGIGLVPEERKEQGVLSSLNVRQNITFATLRQICPGGLYRQEEGAGPGRGIYQPPPHQDARPGADGYQPQRRQSAEGGAGAVAAGGPQSADPGRAHKRHRRGREAGDIPDHAGHRETGHGHHHDLLGNAGADRDV